MDPQDLAALKADIAKIRTALANVPDQISKEFKSVENTINFRLDFRRLEVGSARSADWAAGFTEAWDMVQKVFDERGHNKAGPINKDDPRPIWEQGLTENANTDPKATDVG